MSRLTLPISDEAWLELTNIHEGVFSPLQGFLGSADYRSVVDDMHLQGGSPWTIPVTLDLAESELTRFKRADTVHLVNSANTPVGILTVSDIFSVDPEHDIQRIFGTRDPKHPGVGKELSRPRHRIGGRTQCLLPISPLFPTRELPPAETRRRFLERGWKKVVGFQTRNPIHRAHEHLQRIGLEITDGLFVQPLIGWKRAGDFTPEGVMAAYEVMMGRFYPSDRVILGTLRTPMRYAGPREAVFHAIIRRNYGCTHFIVGRDHAGVGGYYGKYDSQKLALQFTNLGIEILALGGPFYCRDCEGVVTENTCGHDSSRTEEISGTIIRKMLCAGQAPPPHFMRAEVAEPLIRLMHEGQLFNEDSP